MAKPSFTKTVVGEVKNDLPPSPMNTFSAVGDVNGDGRPDIALSGRDGRMVWLENPGPAGREWKLHLVDEVQGMECGGSLWDLLGRGRRDIINGGDFRSDQIFWWENPGTDGKWKKRVVAKAAGTQIHDTLIGDVTGDGRPSLLFTNQHAPGGTTIYRVPLPKDPTVSPWPGLEAVDTGKSERNTGTGGTQPEEGLAIGDIDGDGKNELVAGTHWYKYAGEGKSWKAHKFATGYITTKITIGDLDGDGKNEIVLSEGDPCVYGRGQGGKAAWFKPAGDIGGLWEEHVIEDGLFDAHSLRLGDLCGNGKLDLLVGEVGKAGAGDAYEGHAPRIMVFENLGGGKFARHVIDEGTGIHEAALADMRGIGVLDIVGKPLHGPEKWKVHVYYNNRPGRA